MNDECDSQSSLLRRVAAATEHLALYSSSPGFNPNKRQDESMAKTVVSGLERRLKAHLLGEVEFDAFTRGRYATDASHYQIMPIGVVAPRSVKEAEHALVIAPRSISLTQADNTFGSLMLRGKNRRSWVGSTLPKASTAASSAGDIRRISISPASVLT